MELLSVFRSDNQRMYLTQLLPGMIALWPFAFLVIDGQHIPIEGSDAYILMLLAIYVFVSLGVGILIEDIGSLIELRLEDIYFDLKSKERKSLSTWNKGLHPLSLMVSILRHSIGFVLIFFSKDKIREWLLGCHLNSHKFNTSEAARKHFYSNWDKYLKLTFGKEEPIALRYYRSVLIRFKFQINISAALLLMLFGHLILKIRQLGFWEFKSVFKVYDTWLYLLGVCIVVSILIVEAFKMIELLDEIRHRLIKIFKKPSKAFNR